MEVDFKKLLQLNDTIMFSYSLIPSGVRLGVSSVDFIVTYRTTQALCMFSIRKGNLFTTEALAKYSCDSIESLISSYFQVDTPKASMVLSPTIVEDREILLQISSYKSVPMELTKYDNKVKLENNEGKYFIRIIE